MRQVDAGELIEELARRDTTDGHVKVFSGHEICDIILAQPTIEAVPLEDYRSMEQTVYKLTQALAEAEPKHGRWIDKAAEDCFRCSVCEEYTHMEMPRLLYHYCPNCGARMDGGENVSKEEPDYSQICWASAKCKYKTKDGNCKLNHCVGEDGGEE